MAILHVIPIINVQRATSWLTKKCTRNHTNVENATARHAQICLRKVTNVTCCQIQQKNKYSQSSLLTTNLFKMNRLYIFWLWVHTRWHPRMRAWLFTRWRRQMQELQKSLCGSYKHEPNLYVAQRICSSCIDQ